MTNFFRTILAGALILASIPAEALTVKTVAAPAGTELWHSEQHTLPMIAVSISLQGGSAYNPADKSGLASLTASLLDEGAGDLDSDAFKQALEARAPNDPSRDQLRLTGRREGAVVVIEVADTGPGVPEKARAHLFEAFQGSTRAGGSGLGLAISADLVRAHGGEIRLVEGTIGATFRIIIPDRAVELGARRHERASA